MRIKYEKKEIRITKDKNQKEIKDDLYSEVDKKTADYEHLCYNDDAIPLPCIRRRIK